MYFFVNLLAAIREIFQMHQVMYPLANHAIFVRANKDLSVLIEEQ